MTRPNYEDSVAGELPQDKEYWEELAKRKYPSTYRYDGEDWKISTLYLRGQGS